MGNLLRRLEAKSKVLRSCGIPTFNRLAVRNSIERVVDLAGRKPFRVERQHLRRRKFFRIEGSPPFGILESGSADPRGHWGAYRKQREIPGTGVGKTARNAQSKARDGCQPALLSPAAAQSGRQFSRKFRMASRMRWSTSSWVSPQLLSRVWVTSSEWSPPSMI